MLSFDASLPFVPGLTASEPREARFAWPGAEVALVHAAPAEVRMDLPTHEVGAVLDPATGHEAWVDRGPPKRFDLVPGMGWVVPAGGLAYGAWRHPLRYVEASLEPRLLEEAATGLGGRGPSLKAAQEFADPLILPLLLALHEAAAGGTDLDALRRDALLDALALHLLHGWSDARALGPLRPARAEVRRAAAFVEDNLARPITLDDLAGAACLSRFHFARVFKAETGLAPHAFVMARRLARAERLLGRTRLPLAEVARRSGFSSVARLTDALRRQRGRTASEVRAGR